MAKRRYRPYRSRKEKSRRRVRYILLALIVLIVGVVIVVKSSSSDGQPKEVQGEMRPIGDILPESETPRQPETPETEPVVIEPEPENESEPEIEQAAEPEPETVEEPEAVRTEPIVETVQDSGNIQVPPEDVGTTSPEAQELIEKAIELRGNGKIVAARDLLNHTLDLKLSSVMRATVKDRLAKLAEVWLFDKAVYESDTLTSYYLVQPGDLLAVIAKQYKVPYEALMRINNIERPELLQAGSADQGGSRAVQCGDLQEQLHDGSVSAECVCEDVSCGAGQGRVRDTCGAVAGQTGRQTDSAQVDGPGYGEGVCRFGAGLSAGIAMDRAGRPGWRC